MGFQKVCASLSHFLITLSLQEAVMSAPCLISMDGDVQELLRGKCRPLWQAGFYVHGEPTHNFYEVRKEDALVMQWQGIWLASHSETAQRLINPGASFRRIY